MNLAAWGELRFYLIMSAPGVAAVGFVDVGAVVKKPPWCTIWLFMSVILARAGCMYLQASYGRPGTKRLSKQTYSSGLQEQEPPGWLGEPGRSQLSSQCGASWWNPCGCINKTGHLVCQGNNTPQQPAAFPLIASISITISSISSSSSSRPHPTLLCRVVSNHSTALQGQNVVTAHF